MVSFTGKTVSMYLIAGVEKNRELAGFLVLNRIFPRGSEKIFQEIQLQKMQSPAR